MVLLGVLFTILLFVAIDATIVWYKGRRDGVPERTPAPVPTPDLPAGMFLAPGHTWLTIEPDGEVKIGLDEVARRLIGPVQKIRFPEPNWRVSAGESFCWVMIGEREVPILAPIGGTIEETRTPDPHASGHDPQAWLIRMRPSSLARDLRPTRLAEEAADWLRIELNRLRAAVVELHTAANGTMLDGGELAPALLEHVDESARDVLIGRFLGPR
jgi:glycine cleavage system H lipoate-binding protein